MAATQSPYARRRPSRTTPTPAAVIWNRIDRLPPPRVDGGAVSISDPRSPMDSRHPAVETAAHLSRLYRVVVAVDIPGFSLDRFWRHGVEVVAACLTIAELGGGVDANALRQLRSAALLHDMGRLVIALVMPKSYARLAAKSRTRQESLLEVETDALGLNHVQAGQRLARLWGLSSHLAGVIEHHHDPRPILDRTDVARDPIIRDARLIRLAHALTPTHIGHRTPVDEQIVANLRRSLNLSPSRWEELKRLAADRTAIQFDVLANVLFGCRSIAPFESTCDVTSRPQAGVMDTTGGYGVARAARFLAAFSRFAADQANIDALPELCASMLTFIAEVFEADVATVWLADRETGASVVAERRAGINTLRTCSPANHAEDQDRPPPRLDESGDSDRGAVDQPGLGGDIPLIRLDDVGPISGRAAFQPGPRLGHLAAADLRRSVQDALEAAVGGLRARQRVNRRINAMRVAAERLQTDLAKRIEQASFAKLANLAAGLSHELNTPLAAISATVQNVRGRSGDPGVESSLEEIKQNSHLCNQIVNELLEFAKPEPPEPRLVILETLIDPAVEEVSGEMAVDRGLFRVMCPDPPMGVLVDPGQIVRALVEILKNAVQAGAHENASVQINSRAGLSDETVVVEVVDAGRGMDSETVRQSFDPFFSHRVAGRGRGLGLSLARRLVELNGGRIWIESVVGEGTTVSVELPVEGIERG